MERHVLRGVGTVSVRSCLNVLAILVVPLDVYRVHVSSCRNDTSAAESDNLRDLLGDYMLQLPFSNASRFLGHFEKRLVLASF